MRCKCATGAIVQCDLGLIKVPPQKALDSISLVTPYMKFDSSGIKFTATAPVQHVSPTNDKHVRLKTKSI